MSRWTRSAVVVLAAALAGCTAAPAPPAPTAAPPAGVATNPGPYDSGPVAAPTAGARLGAWVKPRVWGQDGRRAAITGYEESLNRPLDIVNTYRRFDEEFLTLTDREFMARGVTVMLSWASGDTRSIVDGHHDELIRAQARRVRAAQRPVLLRYRWEMDRPNLRVTMWSGPDFVAAWRHTRRIFDEERVTNASWVWCPTAEGFVRGDAPDFYPGDDAVDWTCVDVYAGQRFRPLAELMDPFLRWAARRPKPIIVGEFGVAREWGSADRAAWLRDAVVLFKANPQIKAVAYFESDPDGNPPKGQFQLSDDPPAFAAFTELARDPYFNPGG